MLTCMISEELVFLKWPIPTCAIFCAVSCLTSVASCSSMSLLLITLSIELSTFLKYSSKISAPFVTPAHVSDSILPWKHKYVFVIYFYITFRRENFRNSTLAIITKLHLPSPFDEILNFGQNMKTSISYMVWTWYAPSIQSYQPKGVPY